MKYKWLNKQNNKKIIVFFNGWGMDDNVVKHLDCQDYDVLMFYDYNILDTNFEFESLNSYSKTYLISWSMGVMIASKYSEFMPSLTYSIAINGTLKPINIEYGIHPKIYDLTIKGFNEIGKKRFISSMFNNNQELDCSRELENQHSELIALKNYKSNENFQYNKIYISNDDRIIPTKSQVAFWGIEPNLKSGHCPFFNFKKWSELL